ncbi:leukocyte surface antigen CD53-like [Contarinia nasturtii]|uniref:leukocyte surface antigen CD53-like n=1 Tax=Contarinia nasturtii TaxID=265458 RepID=UPI0012D44A29|nr:leukocyte surface antigen CD53-like [Contarinia nasturtii]
MDHFSLVFTKQAVYIFNLLFGVTAISVLGISTIIYCDYLRFHHFIGDHSWIAPFFLMAIGGCVFLITVLCCYGTIKENAQIIQVFLVLLAWIFFFEIGTSVVIYIKRNQFIGTLDNSFDSMLNNHVKNEEAWNDIQTELKCCGINGPKDWTEKLNITIPKSCCGIQTTANCTEENAVKIGCKMHLLKYLERLCIMLAGTGFGFGWIQIVVIGYASFMFNEFRKSFGQFTQRLL